MDLSPEGYNEINQTKVRPPSSFHKLSTGEEDPESSKAPGELLSSGGYEEAIPGKKKKHKKRKNKKKTGPMLPPSESDI